MRLSRFNRFADSLRTIRDKATDSQALNAKGVYPEWRVDESYRTGERVYYDGTLYSVLQDHVSQEAWTPDTAVSLFAEVLIPDPTIIPDWVQPDSTNPYMKGDKVKHNGSTWISMMDYNVYEPGVYGWEVVEE